MSRHLGPREEDIQKMLQELGLKSLEELIEKVAPEKILSSKPLGLPQPISEPELIKEARRKARKNEIYRNFIGQGYYGCITPSVILRNVLENPSWYTPYTPYQSEISQGRLEALLNFQSLISDMTGLPIANASLLDEGTAVSEAVFMAYQFHRRKRKKVTVSPNIFPQTLKVLKTRCKPLGIQLEIKKDLPLTEEVSSLVLSYPGADGSIEDWKDKVKQAKDKGILILVTSDLLSLCLIESPGAWGADIVVGTSQRWGTPLGFGGPHAAYLATTEKLKRLVPGRIVGVSKDVHGKRALRLALQTREQHIRREKATSNICTSQNLLAVVSSMYAVYHGPEGVRKIAQKIHDLTSKLFEGLKDKKIKIRNQSFFDTLVLDLDPDETQSYIKKAREKKINLGFSKEGGIFISIDETTTEKDIEDILEVFGARITKVPKKSYIPEALKRKTPFLTHEVFNSHHSETQMLRYIFRLGKKDLALTESMIPLGSCTMKLNATTEMIPVTWREFSEIHPFCPLDQAEGHLEIIKELEEFLTKITGLPGVSLQPNAGSQGEYLGLLMIQKYLEEKGEGKRKICFIPESAHGTNPASAALAGLDVVVIPCDEKGNVDIKKMKELAETYKNELALIMLTYPSTHGIFEEEILDICETIHKAGGQVYLDGANMNALVGICLLKDLGVDVCHLNLHKTFCIPHGGGGPGVGPVCVGEHLKKFLPSHTHLSSKKDFLSVSSAPWGSGNILVISWAYIRMMGDEGLKKATQVAILNANYLAKKLSQKYPILYTNKKGWVAHECILDVRAFKKVGVTVDDLAKRLIDYGFHAPTMSWPVVGTLMVEPTESEDKKELDQFLEALNAIKEEVQKIEAGQYDLKDNVLKNSPHNIYELTETKWSHSYSKKEAYFPLPWVKEHKFWCPVGRVDNVYGDKNLVCTCPSIEDYK